MHGDRRREVSRWSCVRARGSTTTGRSGTACRWGVPRLGRGHQWGRVYPVLGDVGEGGVVQAVQGPSAAGVGWDSSAEGGRKVGLGGGELRGPVRVSVAQLGMRWFGPAVLTVIRPRGFLSGLQGRS